MAEPKVKLPTTERVMADVPPPAASPLPHDLAFDQRGLPRIDKIQPHLFQEGRLLKSDVADIVKRVTDILLKEPTVVAVKAPVTVCGDVHGQFYDLVKLFEVGGNPADTTYLFLGDYVDRGNFSCEVIILMYSFKLLYPNSFFMIRGNHECRHLTDYFTFKEECKKKYDVEIYELIMKSFDAFPLAAVMNEQFLCIHGGISPSIKAVDDIKAIDRFKEPPQSGAQCDALWADPMEDFDKDTDELYKFNDVRGCSYLFSYRSVCQFLERNNLLSVIRAHEAQDAGYKMHRKSAETGFPTVITLFSAPNYLDAYNNKGAVLRYENNVMNIRQFNHSPHPYWLPNFMNVFTWSIPFVAEKVAEMLLVILKCDEDDEEEEETDLALKLAAQTQPKGGDARARITAKILAASKFQRMMRILREERENIMTLKGLSERNVIPQGLLSQGPQAIRQAVGDFEKARAADRVNERLPKSEDKEKVLEEQAKVAAQKAAKEFKLTSSGSLKTIVAPAITVAK